MVLSTPPMLNVRFQSVVRVRPLLEKEIAALPVPDLGQQLEKYFYGLQRDKGETMLDWIQRSEIWFQESEIWILECEN